MHVPNCNLFMLLLSVRYDGVLSTTTKTKYWLVCKQQTKKHTCYSAWWLFVCSKLETDSFLKPLSLNCSAQTLDQGKEYEVTVAPGGKPDFFYITRVSAKGLLDALADDIEAEVNEKSESAAECELLAAASPCLVLDGATSKWVRGQVKSSGDAYKVRVYLSLCMHACVCVLDMF